MNLSQQQILILRPIIGLLIGPWVFALTLLWHQVWYFLVLPAISTAIIVMIARYNSTVRGWWHSCTDFRMFVVSSTGVGTFAALISLAVSQVALLGFVAIFVVFGVFLGKLKVPDNAQP